MDRRDAVAYALAMQRTHLIINTKAGQGGEGVAVEKVTGWASGHGIVIHHTRQAGDATRLVRLAIDDGAHTIIAAGGDGTVHEAANGLDVDDGTEGPMFAIVPLGTGNDLARTLGLAPDKGPDTALNAIERGHTVMLDRLRLESDTGERVLINAACGGFATNMAAYLDTETKKKLGVLSYPVAAIRTLADIPWHAVRIEADGEAIETESACVMLANGRYAAGGVPIAPDALLDDGLVDLVVIIAETFAERAEVLARLLIAKAHTDSPWVIHRRVKRVTLECDPAMSFSGDGERIGATPLTCTVEPGALRTIVPTVG